MNPSKSAKKWLQLLRFLWHGPWASQTVSFVGHAYQPRLLWPASHVLSAHAHNSPGIRRKRSSTKHIHIDQSCSCSTQIHADTARGVCALESSRLCMSCFIVMFSISPAMSPHHSVFKAQCGCTRSESIPGELLLSNCQSCHRHWAQAKPAAIH